MLIAITRDVSPAIANCELTYLERVEIDYVLACRQHAAYREALAGLGCRVVNLPAEAGLPDSVFVEDAALVLDEIAILTRPGVASRRPEVERMAPLLERYRVLEWITAPGTLEGGDILRVEKQIFVGLSGRSNAEGIRQLAGLAGRYGYRVRTVAVNGCLHLKSAVSQAGPGKLLINPAWVDPANFAPFELVEVAPGEPQAANALLAGRGVIYPASFPATSQRLAESGIDLRPVDVSELQKAEGAVTCCSLVFEGAE
jgi:dimethylargininase